MPRRKSADAEVPASWRLRHTLRGHTKKINNIAWAPDGRWLASAADDGIARVWDPDTGKQLHLLRHAKKEDDERFVFHIGAMSDGRTVVSGTRDCLRVWDAIDGNLVRTLDGYGPLVVPIPGAPAGCGLRPLRCRHPRRPIGDSFGGIDPERAGRIFGESSRKRFSGTRTPSRALNAGHTVRQFVADDDDIQQTEQREGEIELLLYWDCVPASTKLLFQGLFESYLRRAKADIRKRPSCRCWWGALPKPRSRHSCGAEFMPRSKTTRSIFFRCSI
jgi:hypothetical protein